MADDFSPALCYTFIGRYLAWLCQTGIGVTVMRAQWHALCFSKFHFNFSVLFYFNILEICFKKSWRQVYSKRVSAALCSFFKQALELRWSLHVLKHNMLPEFAIHHITWCAKAIWKLCSSVFWGTRWVFCRFLCYFATFSGSCFDMLALLSVCKVTYGWTHAFVTPR